MEIRNQVFVSSTYCDLIKERSAISETLQRNGFIPVGMEIFPATSEETKRFIKRMIDESDYYLLVVKGRYGSVFSKQTEQKQNEREESKDGIISYTEWEYNYAMEREKPFVVFIYKGWDDLYNKRPNDCSPECIQIDYYTELKRFIKRLKNSPITTIEWESIDDLKWKVAEGISNLQKSTQRSGWISGQSVAEMLYNYCYRLHTSYEECGYNKGIVQVERHYREARRIIKQEDILKAKVDYQLARLLLDRRFFDEQKRCGENERHRDDCEREAKSLLEEAVNIRKKARETNKNDDSISSYEFRIDYCSLLIEYGRLLKKNNEYEEAENNFIEARKLLNAKNIDNDVLTCFAEICKELAFLYHEQNDFEKARKEYEAAISLYDQLFYQEQEKWLEQWCDISFQYGRLCRVLCSELGNTENEAADTNYMKWQKNGEDVYQRIIDKLEQIQRENQENNGHKWNTGFDVKQYIGKCYHGKAGLYHDKDCEKAKEYYGQALEMIIKPKQKNGFDYYECLNDFAALITHWYERKDRLPREIEIGYEELEIARNYFKQVYCGYEELLKNEIGTITLRYKLMSHLAWSYGLYAQAEGLILNDYPKRLEKNEVDIFTNDNILYYFTKSIDMFTTADEGLNNRINNPTESPDQPKKDPLADEGLNNRINNPTESPDQPKKDPFSYINIRKKAIEKMKKEFETEFETKMKLLAHQDERQEQSDD